MTYPCYNCNKKTKDGEWRIISYSENDYPIEEFFCEKCLKEIDRIESQVP